MLRVLYQDEHLVAIDKPAGLLVHRTGLDAGETQFALQMLRDQLGRHVWPVHRLDKGTSGVLLFALDADTARLLGKPFESGEGLQKTYCAVVRGWPADEGVINHPLRRMADDSRAQRVEWQTAVTHYRTGTKLELPLPQMGPSGQHPTTRVAVVTLQPETGRRHQLRRHLKHIAHPILGDSTHGKGPLNRAVAALTGVQRLWLHAQELRLMHPHSRTQLVLASPVGKEWAVWEGCSLSHDPVPPGEHGLKGI